MNEVAQFMHDNIFDTPGWGFDNSTFHAFEKKVFKRQSKWYAQNQTYSTASFEKFFSIVKLICVKFALTKKTLWKEKKYDRREGIRLYPAPTRFVLMEEFSNLMISGRNIVRHSVELIT